MDRYMLRAIFRDRFRNIIVIIIVLFCVIASSRVYDNLKPENEDKARIINLQNCQAFNAGYNMENEMLAENNPGNGTIEGLREFTKYEKWRIKCCEKNLEMLKQGKYYSKKYQNELKRDNFLMDFLDIQFSCDPEKKTLDKECANEIEHHKDYLRLEEMPFDYKLLPYVFKGETKSLESEANDNYITKAKWMLSTLDNGSVSYESKSPYVFLSTLLGDEKELSMVLMLVILFFSIVLVMKWKQKKSFYCICNMNITNQDFFRKYLCNVIAFSSMLFIICTGIFFIYWGIQGGFRGLNSETPYAADVFNSFNTFDHISKFDRVGLSKMYYDFYFDFGFGEELYNAGTRHPYALMKVWQLFLASGVLAFVKMLFYVMLGAGIGFIFVDKSKIIAGGIVAGVLCVTSQLFFSTNKFNPFSVGNSFNTTMGGEGMTYLNAMLVLIASIVILYFGIMYVIRHKDIC